MSAHGRGARRCCVDTWPGNVRELGNLVERLSILHGGGVVDVGQLPPRYRPPALLEELASYSCAKRASPVRGAGAFVEPSTPAREAAPDASGRGRTTPMDATAASDRDR